MDLEEIIHHTVIELITGNNYGVTESVEKVEMLVNNNMIDDNYFIPFHLSYKGDPIRIKKSSIISFYKWEKEGGESWKM